VSLDVGYASFVTNDVRHAARLAGSAISPKRGISGRASVAEERKKSLSRGREERERMPPRSRSRTDRPEPTSVPAAHEGRPEDAPVRAESVAEEVLRLLEERGVPSGAWLVDIAQVRNSLREADALLRRLEEAIVRSAGSEGPLGDR
jgi:hypothetical protein